MELASPSQTIPKVGFKSRPSTCSYNEKIDIWALGVLICMLQLPHDSPFKFSKDNLEHAHSLVLILGLVPLGIVQRLRWSVPSCYTSSITEKAFGKTGTMHSDWADVCKRSPALSRMLQLDPHYRATATDVCDAFARSDWV
jgi:serine/threonine protein kinase